MKKMLLSFFLFFACFTLLAQAPRKFNYQAVVRNNTGTIIANQAVSFRFSIHDATATGTVQYSERHTATTNAFGLVNLQIGGGTVVSGVFTDVIWATGAKFLQVEADITGGATYTNLATMELIAVPYALQAEKAGSFAGTLAGDVTGNQSTTLISANAVTTAKIADNAIIAAKITDASITTAKLVDNAVSTGKVADNAITTNKLTDAAVTTAKIADNAIIGNKIANGEIVKSVNGLKDDVTIAAGTGTSLDINGNTLTINATGAGGDITTVTAGAGLLGGGTTGAVVLAASYGGNGTANTLARSDHNHINQGWSVTSGTGLTLFVNNAASSGFAVSSNSTNFNAAAVQASITSAASQSVAVYANNSSADGASAGIYGQVTTNGSGKAVWGQAQGDNTVALYGSAQGAGAWAGLFQGKVHVNGTLSKAAGSFKIDHPLDPMNKYLSHSFVESPDMMNIYDGNTVLDSRGEAIITMPDYFEALNNSFRYQLTAIGKPSPGVYVAQEITGNRFRIAGGAPNGKISWMVTGIRHDTYANEHRIPVEEMKPAAERGLLLNGDANQKTIGNRSGAVKPRNIELPAPSNQ